MQIVTPEFFVRCGYPISFDCEKSNVTKQYSDDIVKLLEKMGIERSIFNDDYNIMLNKIISAIAYYLVHKKGFGGKNRAIFTEPRHELKDRIFLVRDIKLVRTGSYQRGGWSGYESPEFEPSYLCDQRVHRILDLGDCSIEDKNVIKVADPVGNSYIRYLTQL